MSGGVKAGLIFGLVSLVLVIAFSFVPFGGPLLFGPLAAAVVGALAGYFGVRWSVAPAGVGTGVLAGALAGVGGLIGSIIFFVVAVSLFSSNPALQQQIQDQLQQQQQQSGQEITSAQLGTLFNIAGPALGFCFGVINLVLSLALGALGGWFATRNRTAAVPPTQPPTQPPPSAGPPPLSPLS